MNPSFPQDPKKKKSTSFDSYAKYQIKHTLVGFQEGREAWEKC